MAIKYRLTVLALNKIRKLPLRRKIVLARKLGRNGYTLGTNISENWKADHVTVENALRILSFETGLGTRFLLEEIKSPPGKPTSRY